MATRKSIRKLKPGYYIAEAYDNNDRLIVSDLHVATEEDVQRLKDIGAKTFVLHEDLKEEPEQSAEAEEETDQTSDIDPDKILGDHLDQLPDQFQRTQELYQDTIEVMEDVFRDVSEEGIKKESVQNLSPYVRKFVEYVDDSPASVSVLTQIEDYDEVTFHHSLNVCLLAILYGQYRNFDEENLLDLAFGALVHDIGKLEIPEEILLKPDDLTEEEWNVVYNHPEWGAEILEESSAKDIYIAIAHQHHELPDGTGYPEGKEDVHPYSRIVSVLDSYEAMTAPRPYQSPINPSEAFRLLKKEFFEYVETRHVLSGLIRCLGIFPVGSLVKLTNGEVAVVHDINKDAPKHPVVSIIIDSKGEEIDDPYRIDLNQIQHQKVLERGKIYDDGVDIQSVVSLDGIPEARETIEEVFHKFGI